MGNHIPVIGVTGGPCAGKTTALSYLQQKLADLGFTVITVREVATDFIFSGLKPAVLGMANFQRQLLKHMIEKENSWRESARLIEGGKTVIICDRGAADAQAYSEDVEFDLLLAELGHTMVDLRDRRYDGVIFLHSVAYDAPDLYSRLNNEARGEDVETAREVNARTLAAWMGHPHLRVIDNSTGIEGKLNRVLQAVCRILNIPAPLEIERKYLVSRFDLSALPQPSQPVHIVQYYLKNDTPGEVGRIRSREQGGGYVYYHTVKRDLRPGVRTEVERQITRDEYRALLREVDPTFGKIDKTRYCFVWRSQYFELDFFHNPAGLTLLEIELTEENDQITLPDFLANCVTDVTDDPRYSNREIARRLVAKT